MSRSPAVLVTALAALLSLSPGAEASTGWADLASAGPLRDVYAGADLSCQARHELDQVLEVFPEDTVPGDCGTLVALNGVLYAPDFAGHGRTATSGLGSYTPFTSISQSGVTGRGTVSDPLVVSTWVKLGTSGVQVTQRDSYVVGTTYLRSDITVTNPTDNDEFPILYRALDCFLGASDFGYGSVIPGAAPAVGCSVNPDNTPEGRIEELVPLSPGNHYFEDRYSVVWAAIGAQNQLPDTCTCHTSLDNGAAVSWNLVVRAHASVTRSVRLDFRRTRRPTQLKVPPALVAVRTTPVGETVYALSARATLTDTSTGGSVAGRRVSFTAANETCAATTDSTGTATCTWSVPADVWVLWGAGYGASYAGDESYLPSSDWAHLISVDGIDLP